MGIDYQLSKHIRCDKRQDISEVQNEKKQHMKHSSETIFVK